MAIRVALHHRTDYRYDRPVTLLPQIVRLRPAPHTRTPILGYSLKIEPKEHFLNWQQDPYGNYQARLVFPKPTTAFSIDVDLLAEMTAINPFDFFVAAECQEWPFQYDTVTRKELTPYLETESAGPELSKLIADLKREKVRSIDYLVELNQRLQRQIRYVIRVEPGIQSCEETLAKASGSCRDSAWLLVQLARHLGLAARFCSGYLIQLTADVKALDGPSGPDSDFIDLHAWAEVYLPGAGWIGLDPTSGLLAGEGHIPLAATADPQTAAPVTGAIDFLPRHENDKVESEFRVEMRLTRVHETPRVTKPYTPEQWAGIDALGRRIDEELRNRDVRLTMGGEPTFVSIDCRDAPEWNTASLGEHKRRSAGKLLRRLRDRFAPQGLLHFGQGKWYPGESLPRWALACYWRRDGQPIWEDPNLVADDETNYGYAADEARAFVELLAATLKVDPRFARPGYEDAWYYLWRERRLPTNVDPLASKLDDPEERARLAKVFDQGLNTIVGYALPIRRAFDNLGRPIWESGEWFLRREHLFLIPGDSPMGYRLPLDSLPWAAPWDQDTIYERDPSIPTPQPLPPHPHYTLQSRVAGDRPINYRCPPMSGPQVGESVPGLVRTALCVEPRNGTLHVFMPPCRTTEDYLDLTAAIEATASALRLPVKIEGYLPPIDSRLNHFAVTPDPGVLEVNIHPAHSWSELVKNTNILYEEAHQCRLSTEKFQLDGRHTGTGGGNHIILGGPTPLDSPILRRPDLLRSLVSYWHNHPSLSYLFSGIFVGPTSQAPRVDEARNDSLYELELAFRQIEQGGYTPPWLTDRLFRNLLIDVTGNTHRAEFCIDKLYSPEGTAGRRGLVEFRAFEMPPHPQMSLVQQLLLRALVNRFWAHPYDNKLVRWGTELHDRYMLPHFVKQDFDHVLEEMRQTAYPLRSEWFEPHFEFRFPKIGTLERHGMIVELRHAIEPWHVLGEETTAAGTARYVDSSVERLEVKVRGMIDPRHVVTVNGRRLPLHPTGTNGEYVAGLRYRAWQPPSCLHPTIGVHTPLVFDVYDTWLNRSLAGCTYHVSHPGGRASETFPVNEREAECRRLARFFPFGHTPGTFAVPPLEINPEFPFTLDLRQAPLPAEEIGRPISATRGGVLRDRISANGAPKRSAEVV